MEIIKLQQFQNDFNSAIEKSLNQKLAIETEIKEVLDFVNTIPIQRVFKKPTRPEFKTIRNRRIFKLPICDRRLLSDAFYIIQETGTYDLKRDFNDTDLTNQFKEDTVKQGYVFFEYYKWLNSLLTEPKKEVKKSSLTHKQKLLALHYLGLDTSKFENSKTAKILSEILELSEDNTRQYLSYITAGKNEVRTKANLEKVNQLFENQGFSDISFTIKRDLEKL
jgi:hypothetical protein